MSTPAFSFKLISVILCWCLMVQPAFAGISNVGLAYQKVAKISKPSKSSEKMDMKEVSASGKVNKKKRKKRNLYDRGFRRMIKTENKKRQYSGVFEDTLSGVAALIIGVYGYYNDDRGVLAKLIYSATQTAGIYMISDATFRGNKPNLLLELDGHLKGGEELSYREFRRITVHNKNQLEYAEYKKNTYAGAILSAAYGYSAFRERSNKGLQNVFYFLTFNFILVSSASFYKVFTFKNLSDRPYSPKKQPSLSLNILPLPTVTFDF